MIVHIKKLVKITNKFALGAFNTYNLEYTKGIVAGAVKQKFPLIIQVSEHCLSYAGLEEIVGIIKTVIQKQAKGIPLTFHLDHGKDFSLIKKAINLGFPSVMIDGSSLPFAQNVALTKKVVRYAHSKNVWVQGEIGGILSGRLGVISNVQREKLMTNPNQAKEFVEKTGVDTLAVAIGNVHGAYKLFYKVPRLNISLLKEIQQKVKIPLVLHGGSGINKKDIREAIANGIKIININSDLRMVFSNALRKSLRDNPREIDPRLILQPAIKALEKKVEEKIKLFRDI